MPAVPPWGRLLLRRSHGWFGKCFPTQGRPAYWGRFRPLVPLRSLFGVCGSCTSISRGARDPRCGGVESSGKSHATYGFALIEGSRTGSTLPIPMTLGSSASLRPVGAAAFRALHADVLLPRSRRPYRPRSVQVVGQRNVDGIDFTAFEQCIGLAIAAACGNAGPGFLTSWRFRTRGRPADCCASRGQRPVTSRLGRYGRVR
jgi:hypothetical protein